MLMDGKVKSKRTVKADESIPCALCEWPIMPGTQYVRTVASNPNFGTYIICRHFGCEDRAHWKDTRKRNKKHAKSGKGKP